MYMHCIPSSRAFQPPAPGPHPLSAHLPAASLVEVVSKGAEGTREQDGAEDGEQHDGHERGLVGVAVAGGTALGLGGGRGGGVLGEVRVSCFVFA